MILERLSEPTDHLPLFENLISARHWKAAPHCPCPEKVKALRVLHTHHTTQFFVIRQHLESKA